MGTTTKTTWHLSDDGIVAGPYTTQQLAALGKAGKVVAGMLASKDGGKWTAVEKVKGLTVSGAMPSDRQVAYARDLGVFVVPGMTRDELSTQMDAVIGRSYKTGRFVAQADPVRVAGHVTTEKTGKGIKAGLAMNWVVFLLGLLIISTSLPTAGGEPAAMFTLGSFMVFGSFVAGIVLRIARWWHHG